MSTDQATLRLVIPQFESPLTDMIIDLDHLRHRNFVGTTPPELFFQVKHLFHTLESIGSARIEGNRTTIAEYIETKIDNAPDNSVADSQSAITEIMNMENAMGFIDETVRKSPINHTFIAKLHRMVVAGLPKPPKGEGDKTPGKYRTIQVRIAGADHLPPEPKEVRNTMEELFNWLHRNDAPKYDLLKIAIAHHRFMWIHPFTNGNGRTGRLLTYALLVKSGFNVHVDRILNPSAVFCADRNRYYTALSQADFGSDEGILAWCEYVLGGLLEEIKKIDRLLDFEYLIQEILNPAIRLSQEAGQVDKLEAKLLKRGLECGTFHAADWKDILPGKAPSEITRIINRLKDRKLLVADEKNVRKYVVRFNNNFLLRHVIRILGDKGFLPFDD
jgi:Fic family protein